MSIKNLKEKASAGMLWTSIDRVLVNIGQLAIAIILARILTPEDFGLIAMLYVFLALSNVLINSGMGSALIQKKNIGEIDYSTVFVFNLVLSFVIYGSLFISAPAIAGFYNSPQLVDLTRILGLNLIINALTIVQRSYLERNIDFKSLAKVNVIALVVSGLASIIAALNGLGVWSLVLQALLSSLLTAIGLHLLSTQKVSIAFSRQSFDELFGFSFKLLLAGLYGQSLQQFTSLAIGKYYTAAQLGFFTQAKKLTDASSGTLTSILNQVTFPILSSLQDDKTRMVSIYQRMIKMTAFITFPIMLLIAVMAEPIVLVLLGEKWLNTAILLQILAIERTLTPVNTINMNILKAIGRSDLFLKIDLAKFPIIATTLFVTIPISVKAVAVGLVINSFLSFFVNAYLPGRLFDYGGFEQLKDMFKSIVATIIMLVAVFCLMQLNIGPLLKLLIGLPAGFVVFVASAYLLRINELEEFLLFFKARILKKA